MKSINELIKKRPFISWILFFATIVVVFFLGLLASSIIERRTEAEFAYKPQVKFGQFEPRNEIWGKNFPREGETYEKTADTTFKSKYNGSATIDMLEVDPRLVVLWAGYAFSKDYKQGRGHHHAIEDITNTLRTGAPMNGEPSPQPNTCWACKSPDVPRVMNQKGVVEFYEGTWETKGSEVVNPIGCADCHDSKTMNLHISRPALVEAFQRQGKDVTKATHQEMRTLVCAQCHVEYYFDKKKIDKVAYLTFPWDGGESCEAIESYYDKIEFSDWIHPFSKAQMLKAQHPEYETYKMGVHYERGVSCADCHMPFMNQGGQKFTNHHIQSPLNNIANSCQVCHREETTQLIKDVTERQDKIIQSRDALEEMLVRAHIEAKTAWAKGATEKDMAEILKLIRQAQWRWDFSAASHGASFHAPLEISRIIANGIIKAQEARIKLTRVLAKLGFTGEVAYPDISTKAKAQAYIGLDMAKLNKAKGEFKLKVVPEWLNKAAAREKKYKVWVY